MPPDTRQRLLDAAIDEFGEHGYAGARIVRISEAAGANRERLYHYFGDKAGLLRAALDEAMVRLADAEPFLVDDLPAYVTAMVDFHRRNPALLRLLLLEADHVPGGEAVTRGRMAHYGARVEAVRAAQAAGRLRSDLDPRAVVFGVLALVSAGALLPALAEAIQATDAAPVDLLAQITEAFTRGPDRSGS